MNRGLGREHGGESEKRGLGAAVFFFTLLFASPVSWAQEYPFSVSIIGGIYQPSLNTINRILGNPHQAILQDPNYLLPHNPVLPVEVRDIVTARLSGNANYGVEAQWDVTQKFSLVATVSFWQGSSTAQDVITTFIRQDLPPIEAPRSARYQVSVSQFWLGWKYNLIRDPELGRIYVDVGVLGFSLADLTMDTLFKVALPDQNFGSTSETEARGLAYTARLGLGGEYFLTTWLSLGMDVNYVIGTVTDLKVRRFFQQNFSSTPVPPSQSLQPPSVPVPQGGDQVRYATVQTENISDVCSPASPDAATSPFGTCAPGAGFPLHLELSGLQISAALRFYF